jgi:hypothetical protein
MKLTTKTLGPFLLFLLLGLVIGSVAWEIVERLVNVAGLSLSLSIGPVGFDLRVLAVWVRLNPGSLLGAAGGIILWRSL